MFVELSACSVRAPPDCLGRLMLHTASSSGELSEASEAVSDVSEQ